VRELYKRLASEKWIDPWLDEENLLPGQDFDLEIYKATRDSDAIIICLSKVSVAKEGYVNKEIRRALDIAQEKPEGAIYVIPLRLDACNPSFEQLRKLHWLDYFTPNAHEKLLKALRARASALKIEIPEHRVESVVEAKPVVSQDDGLDLNRFTALQPQKNSKVSYPFWIGKYPVTNAQYERFLNAPDFANPVYWLEIPKFDENCERTGDWGRQGLDWLQEQLEESKSKVLLPRYWDDEDFGKTNPNHPVVGISWYEASAYCEWLFQNWEVLSESKANSPLKPQAIRLPLETEWATAAGGEEPAGRYAWDEVGKQTTSLKEIVRRANTNESGIGYTTSVNAYPLGKSPFGVMDMSGNVWEWQANYY
jgi:formylglycine-generating enzyme required for sulfatase activity